MLNQSASIRKGVEESWKELAFGMFVHFGLYSLCGGVWQGKKVESGYSEQILSHGPVPQADYEALTDMFRIERFDPDEIVSLAKSAGMRYIVLTAKHHDGFCLFNTETTGYHSMNAACHRDIVGEMSKACMNSGLKFGIYYSWIDWHYPYATPISPHNSDTISEQHMRYNIDQLEELLTNYGEICELWMDMGAPTVEQSRTVRELAHRLQPGIMVNGRVWNDCGDFLTMGDNEYPAFELDLPWQTPATIYHETWGYRSWQVREGLCQKIQDLSSSLYSVLSRGGNFLLNIGPAGDGSVVPFERDVLEGIGTIVSSKGLIREPRHDETSFPVPTQECDSLPPHSKLYRYTGGDYYSFHPILTSVEWVVESPQAGIFEVSCSFGADDDSEKKLCFGYPGGTFVFTKKRGQLDCTIVSRLKLPQGRSVLSIHTPGEPYERPCLDVSACLLTLRRQDGR